jgi:hypothetical protein
MGRTSRLKKERKAAAARLPKDVDPPLKKSPFKGLLKTIGIIGTVLTFLGIIVGVLGGWKEASRLFKTPSQIFKEDHAPSGELRAPKIHKDNPPETESSPTLHSDTHPDHYPVIKGIYIKDLIKRNAVMIYAGDFMAMIGADQLFSGETLSSLAKTCPGHNLSFLAKDDRVYISTEFKDLEKEETMGIIEYNHWTVFNDNLLFFYNDDTALEVRDKKNRVTFSIRLVDGPDHPTIYISGYLIGDSSVMTMVSNSGQNTTNNKCILKSDPKWKEKVNTEAVQIKPFFRRPEP